MIPMDEKMMARLDLELRGHGGWPCSNQGRPFGGWEMIVEIKGVPAIIREGRQNVLLERIEHLFSLNGLNARSPTLWGHVLLNLVMQCSKQHRYLSPCILLDCLGFDRGTSAENQWVEIGEQTIGQILLTQEFHKEVLQRMWETWMRDLLPPSLRASNSSTDLLSPFYVRGIKTKEEMVAAFKRAKFLALNNALPRVPPA